MSHIQEISEQVHFAGPQKLAGDACRIILIDSAAGISIFRERDLFTRMWRCNKPKLVSGINPGRSLYIDRIGQTVFGHVYYCEKAAANVVSTGELEQQGFEVTKEKDMFIVKGKDGAVYKFTRGEDNLYRTYVSTDRNDPTVYNVMEMTYDTVEDRKKRYDKRQIERAMEARRLQWNLGLVSTATLIKLLKSGKIRNTDLTPTDVKIAEYIYGPCVGNLRGKTTAPVPKVIRTEPMPMPQTPEQTMYADLLFINKIPFLLTVIEPLEYVMVTKLKGKGTSQLLWAVNKQIASYKQYGYVIRVMHADQESSLLSDGFKSKSPVRVEPCEDAVGIIERKIRVVKERARGIINTLPFKICNVLNIWLVRYVVSRLNMIPTSNYEEYISAREKLYGRGIDYNKDLKYGVFDYVEVFAKSDNTMEPRTTPALALMPTGSLDGAWYFYILETGSIITRHKATKLPMPNNWIKHLNELANAKDQENNEDLEVIMGGRYIEGDPAEPENQEPEGQIEQPQWLVPNIPDNAGEEHNIHPDEIHDEEDVPHVQQNEQPTLNDIFGDSDSDEEPEIEQETNAEAQDPERPYNLRRDRRPPARYSVFNMTINQGIEKHGDKAVNATLQECQQLVDTNSLDPTRLKDLTDEEKAAIIPCKFFLREKFFADGNFEKLKGRMVGGGHKQDRTKFGDLYSPTVSTTSLFMHLPIAHMQFGDQLEVATVDVPGAYLRALPPEGVRQAMRINKTLSAMFIQLVPEWEQYLDAKGCLVVLLKKALYGCVFSARQWYLMVVEQLTALGYTENPYDKCVFTKGTTTIFVHVDDFFITCKGSGTMDEVLAALETKFPGINIHRGRIVNYLGMTFDFTDVNGVKITAKQFITELLRDNEDIQGTAVTPALAELFTIADSAPILQRKQKDRYHSTVMRFMYIAKRIRPDILYATAFLSTRVQQPTVSDENKLHRVLRYIRGTPDMGLKLSATGTTVQSYIDASFAVHKDKKSHTGSIITMGRGAVHARSRKQSINTTSSTTAEQVGVADEITTVLWGRNFLGALGHPTEPAIVFQDNDSTITMLNNGESTSSRTRHIDIKYFFAHDCIKRNEIVLKYKPTTEMIADILTKPLQGKQFRHLRRLLLNWDE